MPCNRSPTTLPKRVKVMVMVFNATFNNISVISWQSFFFVEGTGVLGGESSTCRKLLTNFILLQKNAAKKCGK